MTYFRRNLLSVVSEVRQHQFSAKKRVVEGSQYTILTGQRGMCHGCYGTVAANDAPRIAQSERRH